MYFFFVMSAEKIKMPSILFVTSGGGGFHLQIGKRDTGVFCKPDKFPNASYTVSRCEEDILQGSLVIAF